MHPCVVRFSMVRSCRRRLKDMRRTKIGQKRTLALFYRATARRDVSEIKRLTIQGAGLNNAHFASGVGGHTCQTPFALKQAGPFLGPYGVARGDDGGDPSVVYTSGRLNIRIGYSQGRRKR
jgi:hypothetical protein